MIRYSAFVILLLMLSAFMSSCKDPITGEINNLPPDTFLSLFPDSIIAPGSTLKTIRWWGDDPDGFVAGYRVSFDSINWTFTTKNDSAFILHIAGNDSTFRFFVASVDDEGLVDPTPATNLYPVVNSAPSLTFDVGTELPDTTFPVATFKWTGTDPDGNENIRYYLWSLNDTNNFKRISGNINLLTLTKDSGLLLNSNNIFYLRAEDDAGALSRIIRMPDTSRIWFVRNVNSKILMIRDIPSANVQVASQYFSNAFDTIHYDILDIKFNNGALIPKIVNPMFIQTLSLFDIVFWIGGIGSITTAANFDLSQQSLPFYIQRGGKVFFSSGFQGTGNLGQGNIVNFAPIDSITFCSVPFYIPSDSNLIPSDNSFPVLGASSSFPTIRGLNVSGASVIYKFYKPSGCFDTINIAIKDLPQNPRVIYMALPVYFLNKFPSNSKELFRKIFIEEFGYQ